MAGKMYMVDVRCPACNRSLIGRKFDEVEFFYALPRKVTECRWCKTPVKFNEVPETDLRTDCYHFLKVRKKVTRG